MGVGVEDSCSNAAIDGIDDNICTTDELAIVDDIFNLLDDHEKERAARASSYRYLMTSRPATDERDQHVRALIKRYVIVEQKLSTTPDKMEEIAYNKLKKTLQYREEKQVDDILRCFDKSKSPNSDRFTTLLEDRFATGASYIRGFTKDGKAIFINLPRADTTWEKENYIMGNIYMLERALACTERKTNGKNDKVVVFYDYNGYRLKNSPPPLLVKDLLSDLYEHWPERLEHVFVVDAPFMFRAFWSIIKHFIDPITKDLVQFVTGEEEKAIFQDMISEDQASAFMFNGAQNDDDVDIKSFLHDIPFDEAYKTSK